VAVGLPGSDGGMLSPEVAFTMAGAGGGGAAGGVTFFINAGGLMWVGGLDVGVGLGLVLCAGDGLGNGVGEGAGAGGGGVGVGTGVGAGGGGGGSGFMHVVCWVRGKTVPLGSFVPEAIKRLPGAILVNKQPVDVYPAWDVDINLILLDA